MFKPCSFLLTSYLKMKWLDDFCYDVCVVAVFARWSFVSQSSLAGFFPAASKEGVVGCTREILVFSCSFLS